MRTAEKVRVNTEPARECANARIDRVTPRRQRGTRAQRRARGGLGSSGGCRRCYEEWLLRSTGGRRATAQM
jgi:hypothetical protein